jgi:hypothetical protein
MRSMRRSRKSLNHGKTHQARFPEMTGETSWARESRHVVARARMMLMVDRYQRAFIDFFEDQLVSTRYNLDELLDEYLLGGKEPLINGLIAGRMNMGQTCKNLANLLQSPTPSFISATHTNSSPRRLPSRRWHLGPVFTVHYISTSMK